MNGDLFSEMISRLLSCWQFWIRDSQIAQIRNTSHPLLKISTWRLPCLKRKKKIHQNQLTSDSCECLPFIKFFAFWISAKEKVKGKQYSGRNQKRNFLNFKLSKLFKNDITVHIYGVHSDVSICIIQSDGITVTTISIIANICISDREFYSLYFSLSEMPHNSSVISNMTNCNLEVLAGWVPREAAL